VLSGIVATSPAAAGIGPLVDAAWVGQHSCDDGVVVVDISPSARGFGRGHIPCSVHSSIMADSWRAKRDGVPGMLPDAATLETLIGGLGIGNDDHVVVVGPGGSAGATTLATRIYWTFKVSGHDAVSLLDGGTAAYKSAGGLPIEKGEAKPREAKTFTVTMNPDLLADASQVSAAAAAGEALIDNRGSDYYVGINKSGIAARAGTLPSAENVPITWLTSPDGRFQSTAVLNDVADQTAISASDPQISFCNSGQMASLGWFVAHELLGNDGARLYDGSMADWTADAARPVERKIGGE
jgi:thiosulfate/3-mercaptopyruvate sulfurtransferase